MYSDVDDEQNRLPAPSVPDFSITLDVLPDALVISLVSFATSLSIVDLFARKHKYPVSSNQVLTISFFLSVLSLFLFVLNMFQELFAIGMSNVAGSFFKCFPASGALARSAVQESSGGKTQMASIIGNTVVLVVILVLSSLLETLPKVNFL